MPNRFHFLVNRIAGRGRAGRVWERVRARLEEQARLNPNLIYTFSPAGEPFPFDHLDPETVLVAVGGDGSVHHAAPLAIRHGLTLGVIPAGTGNDFSAALGIPADPVRAVDVLLNGTSTPVDIAQVGERWFINAGGFGLDADIAHFVETHPWVKRRGTLGYAVAFPVTIAHHRPYTVRVTLDGQSHQFEKVTLLIVALSPRLAGGMKIAPEASQFDGIFDICVAHGFTKPGLLKAFPTIYRGTHIHLPGVFMGRAKHIRLDFENGVYRGQFDGERVSGEGPVEMVCRSDVLRVCLPGRPPVTDPERTP
ncbi:diacylglycerol kinase family lipid kinase [Alicyclobacillus sp.]|uniref:diacylglycerol/lipid kinase family protein n=1 Tax=Alicyclobacillus sp. TaxID=61169 RepID=UPI0025B96625|nr:diacylglycerol kinase family lipid kinase [Alicyclobacillus sp.]MCL6516011.1 diacylglycerol kinase family lipid kinase [Alicyclobacillus sp.]